MLPCCEENAVITCPKCGKENQAHYRFCLGCGSELPKVNARPVVAAAPKQAEKLSASLASLAAIGKSSEPPLRSQRPASAEEHAQVCTACGASVPSQFKFCSACGHPMKNAVAPQRSSAPPMAVPQVTSKHVSTARAALVLLRPDGSEGEAFALREGATSIGRSTGAFFASDMYLSPHTATFLFDRGKVTVKDNNSLNGVFFRIEKNMPFELAHNAVFRIGQEIIRVELLSEFAPDADVELFGSPRSGCVGRISLVIGRQTGGNAYLIPAEGLHLGRERGDIVFPDDGYVSGLHCRLHAEGNRIFITDVGSSNGTFVRIKGDQVLNNGAVILLGQQLYRLDI